MFAKTTLLALLVMLAVGAVSVDTAVAAKGGQGKGKGHGGQAQVGVCYVTPDPVAVGAEFAINGSGYAAGEGLTLRIRGAKGSTYLWATADANGTFTARSRVYYPGTNTVSVYDTLSSKLLTTCSFQSY